MSNSLGTTVRFRIVLPQTTLSLLVFIEKNHDADFRWLQNHIKITWEEIFPRKDFPFPFQVVMFIDGAIVGPSTKLCQVCFNNPELWDLDLFRKASLNVENEKL